MQRLHVSSGRSHHQQQQQQQQQQQHSAAHASRASSASTVRPRQQEQCIRRLGLSPSPSLGGSSRVLPRPGNASSSSSSSSSSSIAAQGRGARKRLSAVSALTYEEDAPGQPKARLAVFVSGGGSNFKAIQAAIEDGRIDAVVSAVVTDVPGCGGCRYAEGLGIPTLTFPAPKKGEHAGKGLSAEELVAALTEGDLKADYVILAGYLKMIPESLVGSFKRAMVNIHPALLPSFGGKGCYGGRVHKRVVESGVRFTGPTVHFVDEDYDTGAIIAQRVVPVYPLDTPEAVAARVLKQEHLVYPEVVAALVDGRITFRSDGIPMIWDSR